MGTQLMTKVILVTDYQTWCNKVKDLPLDYPGLRLDSTNKVKVIVLDNGEQLLSKVIRPGVVYIPRLKALGEVAYALFDWYLNPAERVTPNVYAPTQNIIWRQFIPGLPGEIWRGKLYKEKGNLETADLILVDRLLESKAAQRIALLDFIFLFQDRSARNWVTNNGRRFWGIDNGIFWPYKRRHADKAAIKTGDVSHLMPPMEALISYGSNHEFKFQIGVFSSLHAGTDIQQGLLFWLSQIDWDKYLTDLAILGCDPLGYPRELIMDWRFSQIRNRAEWLLRKRRFPTVSETDSDEWQELIIKPPQAREIWKRQWETENLETT
jgi:hypothetical protein